MWLQVPSWVFLSVLAAAGWPTALSQDSVQIQFQTDPVLVATGAKAVLTVVTISDIFSMTWVSPQGNTLGLWVGGRSVLNSGSQYAGRVVITATELQISPVQLTDIGNYTVTVVPSSTTGLKSNSRSILLQVFDAVKGVMLSIPSVALEGGNISLGCTWTSGTKTQTIWGMGGSPLTSNSRIVALAESLIINPVNRSDAGVYTCTVTNPVSAMTATGSLTVYYGPDSPILQDNLQGNCVGGGQAVVGQTVQLSCTSVSLPPALFSWQQNGQPVASDQVSGGVLSLQGVSNNQSGQYVCVARNTVTMKTAQQGVDVTIVQTCLTPGAVAGIVVGSLLAVILIITAIILLLCCRNADRRLRNTDGRIKSNSNPQPVTPPVQSAPPGVPTQSSFWNRAQDQCPDPPLHTVNTIPDAHQLHPCTSPPPHPNGSGTSLHNGDPHGLRLNRRDPDGGGQAGSSQRNPESRRNRAETGQTPQRTLPPMVHLIINTIQPTEPSMNNGQPHTIHLNLNTYPLQAQQNLLQNSNSLHVNQNQANTVPQANHRNGNNLTLNDPSLKAAVPRSGARETSNVPPAVTNGVVDRAPTSDALIQTGFTHLLSAGKTGQHNANTQTYCSEANLPKQPSPVALQEARPMQRPWDRLRGTPAYPNRSMAGQVSQSSSSGSREPKPSTHWSGPEQAAAQLEVGPRNDVGRNPQRPSLLHNCSQIDVSTLGAVSQPLFARPTMPRSPNSIRNSTLQSQSAALNPDAQAENPEQQVAMATQVPAQNFGVLTQAALQMHNAKTHNPFQTRLDQTRAALARSLEPGSQPLPTRHTEPQARRAPTPPPVLPLSQFKALPRQQFQEPRPQQPLAGIQPRPHRHPQGHRHAGTHRQAVHHRPRQ